MRAHDDVEGVGTLLAVIGARGRAEAGQPGVVGGLDGPGVASQALLDGRTVLASGCKRRKGGHEGEGMNEMQGFREAARLNRLTWT